MKKLFTLVVPVIIALAAGCGTKSIRVNVLKPGPISIKPSIKTVALIDRTIAENRNLSIGESILTGEGFKQDKANVRNALDGVVSVIGRSSRFNLKRTNLSLKSSGTVSGGTFPEMLSWQKVADLCKEYKADAILSLESYDSDFIVTEGDRRMEERVVEGDTITVPVYYARGMASIKMGFRLYDLKNNTIADQYQFENTSEWNAKGSSVHDAVKQLIDKEIATKKASYNAGAVYGQRVTPLWTWVDRKFFKKPKNTLVARGARNAEVDDWDGAASVWEKALKEPDDKVAGRAAYNLALAHEIMGDLQQAKKWAEKAYTKFGIRQADDYAEDLDHRLREQRRLDYQMDR